MKFDNIIIGGGLSGLTCGIKLAMAGKKTAIISAGQGSLHFSSGSIDLLGYDAQGNVVEQPLEAIKDIESTHPYAKIGVERVGLLAKETQQILNDAGIKFQGDYEKNHFRLTPLGMLKPAWLTLSEYATAVQLTELDWKEVAIINICGFVDLPIDFLKRGLENLGTKCNVIPLRLTSAKERRNSPSEVRATNLGKMFETQEAFDELIEKLKELDIHEEVVLIPAVVGLNENKADIIQREIGKRVRLVATLPPSLGGVRIQTLLRRRFTSLGGIFLNGDVVNGGVIKDGKLLNVKTNNLPDEELVADHYVLATGSFKSRGLVSNYNKVSEPIFNLDIDALAERKDWTKDNVFEAQPYWSFGVATDNHFNVKKEGHVLSNFYAIGSVLSGHNAIKQGDGTGVSVISAMAVADNILK